MKTVIKRDGRKVPFDYTLIDKAILAAMKEVNTIDSNFAIETAKNIAQTCPDEISVEDIQDRVEEALMSSDYKNVARAYTIYRDKRRKARNSQSNQIISDIVAVKSTDVTRENANMNADTPAGMMMKIASERSKEYVDDFLLSDEARKLQDDNILHVHDKDYYPSKSLTCVQSPIDKILEGGFKAGHGESRPAKRIETASILACISIEQTQNEQHGGQSIPAFDFYMAPYVRKTYIEELKKIEDMLHVDLKHLYDAEIADYVNMPSVASNTLSDANFQQFAINQTVHRVHQAMEALVHNLNEIHSRGGNQVVFSSLNYGTDTSAEGRCVIRELLNTTYRGVGNGSTAIFPIQIMKMKDGVNKKPGDPNYDLYQLGCKVTAKRFFPNFLNLDASFNRDEAWDPKDPRRFEHEVATMGCVDGQEVVTYKMNNKVFVTPISKFWYEMEKHFKVHEGIEEGYEDGLFINLDNVQIQDQNKFVDCYRIIKNPDRHDWVKVTLSNGRVITVTSDHPWSVNGKGTVLTKDLNLGDKITLTTSQPVEESNNSNDMDMAWLKGFILCDGCYDGQMMSTIGLDEADIAAKYCKVFQEQIHSHTFISEQHRGVKGNYLELKNYNYGEGRISRFRITLFSEFGARRKAERNIPQWVFNSNENVRVAFLAGMMDADGYINSQRERAKCQIGSTNKVLAIQTMMLAQSLGVSAKMYENHYCSERPEAVRYRVEFDVFDELLSQMASQKKKDHVTNTFPCIDFNEGEITKIEFIGFRDECSYDVTTASEHFSVSGIRSHNCRTRVYENRHGQKTSIGRGNLSFSTINLPGLALSVRGIEDKDERIKAFFDKLYNALNVMARQLYDRYKFQATALAKQFPLLMSGMWVGSEKLKATDTVESVLKHGTLGMGFIGLAECLVALIGKHHGESNEAQKLGLKIVQAMFNQARVFSIEKNMNYSVLATPAEGLSGKFTKKDRKKYGIVPGVTDRDYYTNSNHVPVYYKCSAQHKAEIEGPYHEMTRGGHIFYVELDGDATHNVQAIDDIVKLMDKYNIGYASVNHNRNRCMNCGYEDAQQGLNECPICGSDHIDTLQRITGYLVGTTDRWNSGKLAELHDRVTHG